MRRKLDIGRSVNFDKELHDKIKDAAKRFNVSFGTIVRECCENDLPKLIDRENKRTKRRTRTHTESQRT